ncbi:hypothetical protein [Sphingomonas sp. LR55]|uniref:hypothetical protein n=1 Tax=Sphingomonas sp. LR55 TaxID=3050231 RepID=UPI002FDFDAC8
MRQHEVGRTEALQAALDRCGQIAAMAQHRTASRRQPRQDRQPFVGLQSRGPQHRCGNCQRILGEEPDQVRIGPGERERAGTGGTHLDRHRLAQQPQPRDRRFIDSRPPAAHQVDQLPPRGLRAETGGHVGSEDRLQAIVEPHIVPRLRWAYHALRTDSLTPPTHRRNNPFWCGYGFVA